MAPTVDWLTKVVTIPQSDLTLVSGTTYELDMDAYRFELKAVEASEEGMPHPDIHNHVTDVLMGGVTFAPFVIIINGYTLTFEDGQYSVNVIGANTNTQDVLNRNQVSVATSNSAGLILTPNADVTQVLLDLADILIRLNADEELLPGGIWRALESGTANVLLSKDFTQDVQAGTMSLKE